MGEYYCTKCGATLDDQSGFDPNCSTWFCTFCGQLLTSDNFKDSDMYPGVAWFCDECGALLNEQSGFTDYFNTWTCTECYHENGITENDIYESEEDYERQRVGSQSFLGSFLTGVVQGLFEQSAKEDSGDETVSAAHSGEGARIRERDAEQERQRLIEKSLHKKRVKAFIFKKKRIPVSYDSQNLIGRDVFDVKTMLHNSAFKNIECIPLKDIYIGSSKFLGEVEQIDIMGSLYFGSYDMFPYDVPIIIKYHDKREITIPFTSKSNRKKHFTEVLKLFQTLGFTEIKLKPIKDIIIGWITKDGAVETVIIDGDRNTKKNITCKYDVEIVIEYHTR